MKRLREWWRKRQENRSTLASYVRAYGLLTATLGFATATHLTSAWTSARTGDTLSAAASIGTLLFLYAIFWFIKRAVAHHLDLTRTVLDNVLQTLNNSAIQQAMGPGVEMTLEGACCACQLAASPRNPMVQCLSGHRTHLTCLTIDPDPSRGPRCPQCIRA